jgi:hypothetical protein
LPATAPFERPYYMKLTKYSLILLSIFLLLSCCGPRNSKFKNTVPSDITPNPIATFSISNLIAEKNNCSSTCWENIAIGFSTDEDVKNQLSRLVNEHIISRYWKTGNSYMADFSKGGSGNLVINITNMKVDEIIVDDPSYDNYRLNDIIQGLGPPEAFIGKPEFVSNEVNCANWDEKKYESPSIYPQVIYPTKGIAVTISVPSDYIGCILPQMKFGPVYYFTQTTLSDLVNTSQNPLTRQLNISPETVIQWHGYGTGY